MTAPISGSRNELETPDEQNFVGRLRGYAGFLASNYKELSPDEAQVIVRALESAADHVEAYLAPLPAEIDRTKHGKVLEVWNDCMANCETLEMTWPKLVKAMRTSPSEKRMPGKLWLWKNFVDGRPEYWAFDNPYPCKEGGGDPLTLGEPCGYAIFKESTQGRFDVPEAEVIAAIKGAQERSKPASTAFNGWIACKDKMPEGGGSVYCAGLDPDGNWWRETCSADWLRDTAPEGFATHWQPLPAFPSSLASSAKVGPHEPPMVYSPMQGKMVKPGGNR